MTQYLYCVKFEALLHEQQEHDCEYKIYTFYDRESAIQFRDYMIEDVGVDAWCVIMTTNAWASDSVVVKEVV
jgi:hypothetical protein